MNPRPELKKLFVLIIVTCSLTFAHAQPSDPGPDPYTPPDEDTAAPIDGGLSLLVAAGIGYGIKKARDNRKKEKSNC